MSPEETRVMERIVMERGGLTAEQAATVVQIAQRQQALFGGTEDYLVTREFASGATRQQKLALLDCCMAVAATNADVSVPEDDAVREIASELGLSHVDFVAARASYREYLAVLKTPSGTPEREFSTERRARRVTTTPWAIAGGRIDVMPESPVTSPDDPGSPGRSRAR